jgi:small GTP-binding protein
VVALSAKVCLLGDYAVGKTSLVRRFVYNMFDDRYLSTIGVKVSRKVVALARGDDVVELTLMLWDLAGSEEFDSVRASYLRGAVAGLIVCDVTQPITLATAPQYAQQIRAVNPKAALVLAANKVDLTENRAVSDDDVCAMGRLLAARCLFTSAKSGEGVDEAFRDLGRLAIGA